MAEQKKNKPPEKKKDNSSADEIKNTIESLEGFRNVVSSLGSIIPKQFADVFKHLQSAFQQIGDLAKPKKKDEDQEEKQSTDKFADFKAALADSASAVQDFAAKMRGAAPQGQSPGAQPAKPGGPPTTSTPGKTPPISQQTFQAGGKPPASLAKTPEAPSLPTGDITGGAEAAEGGAAAGGGAMAALGPIAAVGAAAMAAAEGLKALMDKARSFVDALSPSTLESFDRAMRDLQATVGVAFTPIFTILTGTIRQVSGIILPLMEQLRPVIAQVTDVIGGQLLVVARVFAAEFKALIPIVKLLADLFEIGQNIMKPFYVAMQMVWQGLGFLFTILKAVLDPVIEVFKIFGAAMDALSEVMNVVSVVMDTLMQSLQAAIASVLQPILNSMKPAFEAIVNVTKKVIEGFLIMVATMAKMFGANDFLKNLIENLKPKSGATAAAQGVGIQNVSDIAKDISVAAAGSSGIGGDETKKEVDFLSDAVKSLEKIQAGDMNPARGVLEKIQQISDKLDQLARMPNEIHRAIDDAYKKYAPWPLNR